VFFLRLTRERVFCFMVCGLRATNQWSDPASQFCPVCPLLGSYLNFLQTDIGVGSMHFAGCRQLGGSASKPQPTSKPRTKDSFTPGHRVACSIHPGTAPVPKNTVCSFAFQRSSIGFFSSPGIAGQHFRKPRGLLWVRPVRTDVVLAFY
jgi:hypothetical protein